MFCSHRFHRQSGIWFANVPFYYDVLNYLNHKICNHIAHNETVWFFDGFFWHDCWGNACELSCNHTNGMKILHIFCESYWNAFAYCLYDGIFCHTIRNHILQLRLDGRVTSLSCPQWGCLCCYPPRPPGGLLEVAGGYLEVLNWSGVNHGIVVGCNTVNCRQPWKSFHVPWRYGSLGRARWPQHSCSFDMCRCEQTFHIWKEWIINELLNWVFLVIFFPHCQKTVHYKNSDNVLPNFWLNFWLLIAFFSWFSD